MFKRRNPRQWYQNLKEWFWPSAGWARAAQYYGHRVTRLPGSSYAVAAGLATGVAVSFTPFLGLHLALSLGAAFLLRGSLLAAAIGTLVGNPWTFPFIWLITYRTGHVLMGGGEVADISSILRDFSFFHNPLGTLEPVLAPLLVGSVPFIIVSWVLVYFPTKKIIKARKRKIAARAAVRAREKIARAAKRRKADA